MGSSAAERTRPADPWSTGRVGPAFQLLMRLRMLIAALTLLLLPREQLSAVSFLLVLSIVVVSWLAARQWWWIAPRIAAHPLLLALDICLSFVVLGLNDISGPFFLSTVVTAAVAGLLYRWEGMLAAVALQVLCYYATYGLTAAPVESARLQTLIGQPLFYLVIGFAGVALRRLLDDLTAQEHRLRRAEVIAAAAHERARLAREMHDSLAKTLRGIALAAAALPVWVHRDAVRAAAEAERITAACESASREARALLTELRDEAALLPLPDAVAAVVRRWGEENGVTVTCAIDERADLPLRTRHEVLAIVGEALTNVERHAAARSVEVTLARGDDGVELTMRDDGRGFERVPADELSRLGHYGLIGLGERAEGIGGELTVESAPGAGTTIVARFPVVEQAGVPAEVSR